MGIVDVTIAVIIVAGAGYLLYHSLWKKKGHCTGSGCGGSCATGKRLHK
ncbi:FeoB-associated Cys-rich membrane protein [Geobacter sp. DSM 9736]|nr:FeoB-associated Cys-rich membrane protein [Geobacter sp. DSM 9736]SNB44764.1 Virus attachment protein p12 family protein [Geobacter sp. DSM 9736]